MKQTQADTIDRKLAEETIKLGKFLLKFSRVERATFHEDGTRPETDADHTVMLATIACAFAAKYRPDLDIGLIAQYSVVHDMVETYAGDVETINLSKQEKDAKDKAEHEAYLRIRKEFGAVYPWLPDTIQAYESLNDPESRFVKTMDKCMPVITHMLNNAEYLRQINFGFKDYSENRYKTIDEIGATYGHDQPEVLELKRVLADLVVELGLRKGSSDSVDDA